MGTDKHVNAVKEVTDADFRSEVAGASARQTVVVMFWMRGCGHCHEGAPHYKRLAHGTPATKFVRAEIHRAPRAATAARITGAPTYLVLKSGRVVRRIVGNDFAALARAVA